MKCQNFIQNFADLCLKNAPFFGIFRPANKKMPLFLENGTSMGVHFGREWGWGENNLCLMPFIVVLARKHQDIGNYHAEMMAERITQWHIKHVMHEKWNYDRYTNLIILLTFPGVDISVVS